MHPTKRNNKTFAEISVTINGPLPKCYKSFECFLNVRCNSTRYTKMFTLKGYTTAELARIIYMEIRLRYSAIVRIHSDNGPNFMSALERGLADLVDIKRRYSVAYYPQSNGNVESSFYTTNLCLYPIADK